MMLVWLAAAAALLLLQLLVGRAWARHRLLQTAPGPGAAAALPESTRTGAEPAAGAPSRYWQGKQPLPLPAFVEWVQHRWDERLAGAARQISKPELAALAYRAGFADGLHPSQPPLPSAAAARFSAWLERRLDVLTATAPALQFRGAQLVAGMDVGRAEALASLRRHAPGTFVLRLASVDSHLVVSLVEDQALAGEGGNAGRSSFSSSGSGVCGWESEEEELSSKPDSEEPDPSASVTHFLVGLHQLQLSGLARMVEHLQGCVRVLDVSTGRTHPVRVLRKAERAHQAAAAHQAATARLAAVRAAPPCANE